MPRILVVADEPWVRNEVHAVLSLPGYELIDHDDPSSAADVAWDLGVDAVVVDLQVDAMGGMAVTRAIREQEQREGMSIPVILLTDREADGFLARRSGATAWVSKPIHAAELRDAIRTAGVTTS